MNKFNKKENVRITCRRPFHRVAIAYCCSRNTAKKYIGWAVAVTKCITSEKSSNSVILKKGWICFEDYRDFRTWKRQEKEQRGTKWKINL